MSSPDLPASDLSPAVLPASSQRHSQLRDFLLGAFEREQYLQLLTDTFGPEWIHKLPPGSYTNLVHDGVLQMERERCIDSVFFAALLRARPRCYEEIRNIGALWGVLLPPLAVLRQLKTPLWCPWVIAALVVVVVTLGITLAMVLNNGHGGAPPTVPGATQTSSADQGTTFGGKEPAETGPAETGTAEAGTPLPKLTDLEYVDDDGLSLEDKIAAQNGMKQGFRDRMGDIRGCYTNWTTVDALECPYEPFLFFTVWYDVTITEEGKIIEVRFKTSSMVRSTPDICVRDAWLLRVVKAPKIWKGRWTLRIDVPAPRVPIPGARGCDVK